MKISIDPVTSLLDDSVQNLYRIYTVSIPGQYSTHIKKDGKFYRNRLTVSDKIIEHLCRASDNIRIILRRLR